MPKREPSVPEPLRAAVSSENRSSLSKVSVCLYFVFLGRQAGRLCLMVQPPHPAIGHRGNHDASRLSTAAESGCQGSPPLVAADQPMCRLDQQGSQFVVAGLDESRI